MTPIKRVPSGDVLAVVAVEVVGGLGVTIPIRDHSPINLSTPLARTPIMEAKILGTRRVDLTHNSISIPNRADSKAGTRHPTNNRHRAEFG